MEYIHFKNKHELIRFVAENLAVEIRKFKTLRALEESDIWNIVNIIVKAYSLKKRAIIVNKEEIL